MIKTEKGFTESGQCLPDNIKHWQLSKGYHQSTKPRNIREWAAYKTKKEVGEEFNVNKVVERGGVS